MKTCVICNKRGLFLKLNTLGQCESCACALEREETKRFNEYYTRMLSTWKNAKREIDIGNDPIAAINYIPQIQSKIEMCDSVLKDMNNKPYRSRLINQIMSGMTYHDESAKHIMLGSIDDWDVNIMPDPVVKKYNIDKVFKTIENKIQSHKKQLEQQILTINTNACYKQMLDNIPLFNITLTDTPHKQLAPSELEELIKYSNITAKSDIDKLGNFVAIDTETTGFSSTRDHLVEVAAVRFEDWTPVEKFQCLINPGSPIPLDAIRVHGITDDMVKDAPTYKQIIDSLDSFIGKSTLVGHNLPFDLKFLYHYGWDFTSQKRKYYDTCAIAKKTLKTPRKKWDREYEIYEINENYPYDVDDYKLVTLCDYYGLRDNTFAHRALSDAYSAGLLFQRLIQNKTTVS